MTSVPLRSTLLATALAAALLVPLGPAAAQDADQASNRGWAAQEVFQALERNMGTEGYWDAMEAITDVLGGYDLIAESVEDYFDRRETSADWNWSGPPTAVDPLLHDRVIQALRRIQGTGAYFEAMEAAADELEGEDMLSDAAADYFDRASRRWNGYGYGWGGYGWRASPGYRYGYGYGSDVPLGVDRTPAVD